ncbi:MAG: GGDEF domain-containing protein [Oscillospiraceae bacterium]|nr:GGDEF domain-containing protein [Oscillospiraceae bacterium]
MENCNCKRMMRELRKYQMLSDMSGDIVFEYSVKSGKIVFSETVAEQLGRQISYDNIFDIINESYAIFDEDREELSGLMRSISPQNPRFISEMRIILPDGEFVWYELYVNSIWDIEDGDSGVIFGKLVNIDRRKRETDKWRIAADTDPLTKLLNKRAFQSRVTAALKSEESMDSALFFIDLDNFKGINDTFGHQFGDEVLINLAGAISRSVRATDIAGRIGGDEFAIFIRGIGSIDNIEHKAGLLSKILRYEHEDYRISGSIGIARFPFDADNYASLLSNADKALYHMKNDGKDGYVFYNREHDSDRFTSRLTETES